MNPSRLYSRIILAAAACLVLIGAAHAQTASPSKLIQTIPLPGIPGKFDHMAIDIKGQRLMVAAETHRLILILDLRDGKVLHTIKDLPGDPRKVVYNVANNQFWVDFGNGDSQGYDGTSYALIKTLPLAGPDADTGATREPDNGIYDAGTGLFYVGNRGAKTASSSTIDIIDTNSGTLKDIIKLPDHDPTGLAVDSATGKLYVTLAGTGKLAVVDLAKHAMIALWPITGGPQPHALGLDAANHRLFIGSRVKPGHFYKPGKMIVMNADTGDIIQALDSDGGADEMEFDPASHCVYLTCASGAIDVFDQIDPDHYKLREIIPTGLVAKTSLLVPEQKRLYSAVPLHIISVPPVADDKVTEDAKILVFEVP